MMEQRINFYQEAFRPRFDLLAPRTLVQVALGLVGMLVVLAGMVQWHLATERSAVRALQANRDAAVNRVSELAALHPERVVSEALSRELAQLGREKKSRQQMLSLLEQGRVGTDVRFSPILRELALARTEGAWLTGIGIFDSGAHLLIEGGIRPQEAERLPALMESIRARPLLQNKVFGHLRVDAVKDVSDRLHFQFKTDTDRELIRFWDQEENADPLIKQKADAAIREQRQEMQDGANPLRLPKGMEGQKEGGNPAAPPKGHDTPKGKRPRP